MLLIYGTRIARHTIGYVGEECPCCGRVTVCRLLEVSQGGHFFYIPMGRGSFPLGHEARCLTCRHPFDVPAIYYHDLGRKKKATVAELIPLTSPWLGAMEARERQDEWRFRNILNVFMRYDASFRERGLRGGVSGGMQFDWLGGVALMMMLVVPAVMAWLVVGNRIPFLSKPHATGLAWIVSAAAFVWGIYMIATEERRHFRRHFGPRIHAELAPLGAQKSDWEAAIRRMKRLRFPGWKMLKAELRRRDFPAHQEVRSPGLNRPNETAGAGVWTAPRAPLTFQ